MESASEIVTGELALRLKNAAASAFIVLLACAAYSFAPFHQDAMHTLYGPPAMAVTGQTFMVFAAGLYATVLAVYLLTEPNPGVSKSLRFLQLLARFLQRPAATIRSGLKPDERLAVLTTLLKCFFAPLMTLLLMRLCMGALQNGIAIADVGFEDGALASFNRYGFWFLFQVILFLDVGFFTVGYLVEVPRLGNQIRSVDPTLVGWAAALFCYPPFNSITAVVIGAQVSEFPQFDNPTLHLVLNLLNLALMAGYASASVALGFKASNLTHRGIIARGPYAFVRHPAYVLKNMAWWIGSIPTVNFAFHQSTFSGLQAVGSVVGVTLLYVLRALTEEDHLRGVDGDYANYAAKVRYRFIPGLI